MQKQQLQRRPPYPIESVDNALRLLQLLRDGGNLRITDAARELGIAASTAHRLMAMLVYRGFALQDDQRRYVAGPSLGVRAIGAPWIHELRNIALGPMEFLCAELDETVNLVVRVGTNIRFLTTVEARAILRIGDRSGTVIPAIGASSGKALLACEPEQRLRALYRGRAAEMAGSALDGEHYGRLLRELETVRANGYAVSREETEPGVSAVGVAIRGPGETPLAAVSVSVPAARLERALEPARLELLFNTRDDITRSAGELQLNRS